MPSGDLYPALVIGPLLLGCGNEAQAVATTASSGNTSDEASTTGTTGPGCDDGGCSSTDTGDLPTDACEPDFEQSHRFLWLARDNGTVAKIDLVRFEEVARYRFSEEDQAGRTEVGLSGDVIVHSPSAFSAEGPATPSWLVIIHANEADCPDRNDNGSIQTSRSREQLLPFGEDECVERILSNPEPSTFASSRALWTPGVWSTDTCSFGDEMIWTDFSYLDPTTETFGRALVLMDPATGDTLLELEEAGLSGVVDADGNLVSAERAISVDGNITEHESWAQDDSATGAVVVRADGRWWFCGSVGIGGPFKTLTVGPLEGNAPALEVPNYSGFSYAGFYACLSHPSGDLWGRAFEYDGEYGDLEPLIRIDTENLEYDVVDWVATEYPLTFDVQGRVLLRGHNEEDDTMFRITRPATGDTIVLKEGRFGTDPAGTRLVTLYQGTR